MFVSGPGEPNDFADAVGEGLLARVVFTEIDHNYVNSVTTRYLRRVNKAFEDLPKWNRQSGYGKPEYTFNEYMTWAVFTLFAYDYYGGEDFKVLNRKVVNTMVKHRKFVLFEAFNEKLLDLYLAGGEDQTIPALYPAILDWANEYKPSAE